MSTLNKFPVEKRLDLSFLGQGWNTGAEIVFSGLTFAQTQELAKVDLDSKTTEESSVFVLKFLQDHFLRGKAWDGAALVDLTPEDFNELPAEVTNKSVDLLTSNTDPKS